MNARRQTALKQLEREIRKATDANVLECTIEIKDYEGGDSAPEALLVKVTFTGNGRIFNRDHWAGMRYMVDQIWDDFGLKRDEGRCRCYADPFNTDPLGEKPIEEWVVYSSKYSAPPPPATPLDTAKEYQHDEDEEDETDDGTEGIDPDEILKLLKGSVWHICDSHFVSCDVETEDVYDDNDPAELVRIRIKYKDAMTAFNDEKWNKMLVDVEEVVKRWGYQKDEGRCSVVKDKLDGTPMADWIVYYVEPLPERPRR